MHCNRRVRSTDLPHNANGAGIAADPTLTSAWIPCSLRDFWRTFRLAEFRAYLAPDVWLCSPNLAIGASEFRHRRSHRHPAFAPALLRLPKPKGPGFRCHAQLPGRDRVPLPIRACGFSGLRHPCHPFRPDHPACPVKLRRALLKRARLHLAEASSKPSLDERVDMFHRHPWELNQQNFKALRRSVPVDPCPEDKLKLRLNRRSGNICALKFSTFARIPCGHGWISQQLVAFVRCGAQERAQIRPHSAL